MSKELDLDFSEMMGKDGVRPFEEKKEPPPISNEAKKIWAAAQVQPTGTVIAVPTKEKNKWLLLDIAECTNEQYFDFCKAYYPVGRKTVAEDFTKLSIRVRSYDKIKEYHGSLLRKSQKESIN